MVATKEDYERLAAWACILNPDQNIDRRQCRRTVPMEVLSLGAPRTGTLSMREAYEILGYSQPYHYASIFANCRDADMWIPALEGKVVGPSPNADVRSNSSSEQQQQRPHVPGRAEFDQLLGHCGAVTDVPAVVFWRELVAAYPEAKVVLVERDEEKWLVSIRFLITGILNPVGRYGLRFTDPRRTGRILNCGMAWIRSWFNVLGPLTVDAAMENARATYRAHYAEIRKTVPPERLLEYRLGSGWEPLCEFLGRDVPDVPFPHVNDAATLDKCFGTFLANAFRHSFLNIAPSAAVGVFALGIAWQFYTTAKH